MAWVLNRFASLKKYILHVGCSGHVFVLRLIKERWSSDQNWFVLLVVIPQVTNAQLEALRIENRHLRETALNDQLTVSFRSGRVQEQSMIFCRFFSYMGGDQNRLRIENVS